MVLNLRYSLHSHVVLIGHFYNRMRPRSSVLIEQVVSGILFNKPLHLGTLLLEILKPVAKSSQNDFLGLSC